jgi:hypothetical protein
MYLWIAIVLFLFPILYCYSIESFIQSNSTSLIRLTSDLPVSKISKVTSQISIPKQVSAVPDHHKTMDFTVNDKKESLTWLL